MRTPIALTLGLLLCGGCSRPAGNSAGGASAGGARADAGGRVVPVATAPVQKRDVPVYLDGLGSAVAFKTVTVRPQVDGLLTQVPFQEGQAVRKGEVLAQIDPRPYLNQLHQAEGQLARDQAALDTARTDLARYVDLAQTKLIAQQQADQQKGLVAQSEGTVRIDQAAVDAARLNLEYTRIGAPIDGVAGIRAIDPGNIVHASDPAGIVVLTQLDPIAVIFTLPQDVLTEIARQKATGPLPVVVFDRDGDQELGRGTLEVIDNAIIATTATLRLKAVLPNPQHALWPNQFVKARLMLSSRPGALVVPAASLQRGPQGTFVYIVGPDQTAQPRPVVVDLLQGDDALIAKGVDGGETVVTEGQNQLRPGSKVSVRPARPGQGGAPEASKAPAAGEGAAQPGPGAKADAKAAQAPANVGEGATRVEHRGRGEPRPGSALAKESP